jgi:hypothetical protein
VTFMDTDRVLHNDLVAAERFLSEYPEGIS